MHHLRRNRRCIAVPLLAKLSQFQDLGVLGRDDVLGHRDQARVGQFMLRDLGESDDALVMRDHHVDVHEVEVGFLLAAMMVVRARGRRGFVHRAVVMTGRRGSDGGTPQHSGRLRACWKRRASGGDRQDTGEG